MTDLYKSDVYPTREKVIAMYKLDQNEQVYLADELLEVEKMAFEIRQSLI